jgi:hypothetical protein
MITDFQKWFLSDSEEIKKIHVTQKDAKIIWNAAIKSIKDKNAILPKELTYENGAKSLLRGEFFEDHEVMNPDYCGESCEECARDEECGIDDPCREYSFINKVPVSWTTIKEIYKRIVKHYQDKPC